MFDSAAREKRTYTLVIVGLLALSLTALGLTVWIMVDFLREQEIVQGLIQLLPPEAAESAVKLAGGLRWQFRLTILVLVNLVVTGFALQLLWRGYRSSQESLRDFKVLAADILSSMDQGVIATGLDGLITRINRRAYELLNISGDRLGQPLRELSGLIPLEEFWQSARADREADSQRDYSFSLGGNSRTLRAFCQPLQDHDLGKDIGYVIQIHDVTERLLIEERMRRMERYMGLGSLAAGLHHEIKNPLAALSLHVQLLEERLIETAPAEDILEMLGVVNTEMTRIGGVLESFSDFASLDRLSCGDVQIVPLIEHQVRLIAPRARRQQVKVHFQPPAARLPSTYADGMRLEQVLMNLLVNAIEAMPGGGELTVQVAALNTARNPSLLIRVMDTGAGIPPELRERIFDPYFTTKPQGTGMGLALCDKIIRQHHGSLDCHSSPHGAVFEVTLPLIPDSPADPT